MVIPSAGSTAVFMGIVAAVGGAFLLGVSHTGGRLQASRATLGLAAWMGLTGLISASGVLDLPLPGPPPVMFFLLLVMGGSIGLALSPVGRKLAFGLPLWALIGVQGFRFPLELLLHRWWIEGVVPVQMTYSGQNFDILTGILALLAGAALWRGLLAERGALVINLIGAGLLLNVLRLVMQTADTPLRIVTDEPLLELVNHFPYGWIASVCVAGALVGHLLVFRRLLTTQAGDVQRDAA